METFRQYQIAIKAQQEASRVARRAEYKLKRNGEKK